MKPIIIILLLVFMVNAQPTFEGNQYINDGIFEFDIDSTDVHRVAVRYSSEKNKPSNTFYWPYKWDFDLNARVEFILPTKNDTIIQWPPCVKYSTFTIGNKINVVLHKATTFYYTKWNITKSGRAKYIGKGKSGSDHNIHKHWKKQDKDKVKKKIKDRLKKKKKP